jgi:hypothetical protein
MPAPGEFFRACASASARIEQQHARWRVICPTRLPYTEVPSFSVSGANLSSGDLRSGYLIGCLGFRSTGGLEHWVLAGGDPKALNGLLHPNGTRAVGRPIRIDGRRATRYLVTPGTDALYSDHVVIAWSENGTAYQVSVHRWPDTRVATAQAERVAANIMKQ